jgi:hypothetical protein
MVVVVVVVVVVDPQAESISALPMIAGTVTRARCIGVRPLPGADTSAPQAQISNESNHSHVEQSEAIVAVVVLIEKCGPHLG